MYLTYLADLDVTALAAGKFCKVDGLPAYFGILCCKGCPLPLPSRDAVQLSLYNLLVASNLFLLKHLKFGKSISAETGEIIQREL